MAVGIQPMFMIDNDEQNPIITRVLTVFPFRKAVPNLPANPVTICARAHRKTARVTSSYKCCVR